MKPSLTGSGSNTVHPRKRNRKMQRARVFSSGGAAGGNKKDGTKKK